MSIRVILADDHPLVLAAVRNIVEEKHGFMNVVAEAHNGTELLLALAQHQCDMLITDLTMPGGDQLDGMPMIKKVRRNYPDLPIVLLTQMHNDAILHPLIKEGVNAIVLKKTVICELSNAIKLVLEGQSYIDPALRKLQEKNIKSLSLKEAEVIRLLASGMSVSQVANHLHRSIKTISSQKKNAMARLGISSDSALFEYVKSNNVD